MPTAEAHVPTNRASRYLAQLCRHASQMGRMRHLPTRGATGQMPEVQNVDYSDTAGTIHFGEGECTLRADADTLTLRVDAADEDTLQRLQDGIARRLATIGRRDHLTVTWHRSDSAPDTEPAPAPTAGPRRHRRLGRTLLLAGAAALALALHLGLLGGAIATSGWTSWGTNILGIVMLKILMVGAHVLLGRFAIRRGKAHRARRQEQRS